MTDTVLLAIDGPRATITLNDPAKHNRLDPAGLGLLRQAIEKADSTPDVRVTVITGAIFVICVLAFRRGIVGELSAWWARRQG